MKIICPKCRYEWITKSSHIYVSCPSCLQKVNLNNLDNSFRMKLFQVEILIREFENDTGKKRNKVKLSEIVEWLESKIIKKD